MTTNKNTNHILLLFQYPFDVCPNIKIMKKVNLLRLLGNSMFHHWNNGPMWVHSCVITNAGWRFLFFVFCCFG